MPYSKANANSGTRGGVASVWKRRVGEHHGSDRNGEGVGVQSVRLEAILDMCRSDGDAAMVAAEC